MFSLAVLGSAALIAGVIALYSPFIGLLAMLVLVPVEELTVFIGGRTVVWFLGVATFGACLLRVLGGRSKIQLARVQTALAILWLFWGLASSYWSVDQANTLSRAFILCQAIVFFILLQNLITNNRRFCIVVTTYFAAVTIVSLFAINTGISTGLMRVVLGERGSPIHLAQALGIGLLMIPYLLAHLKRFCWRILIALGAGSLVIAILMTGSRGAWVGLLGAVGFTWLVTRGKTIRARSLIAVGVLLTAGIVSLQYYGVITDWTVQRILTLPDLTATQGGAGRTNIWQVGWELVKDNPIIGVGLQEFAAHFKDYIDAAGLRGGHGVSVGRDPHNIFLSVLGELGVIGFIIVVGFFWTIFKALFSHRGDSRAVLGLLLLFYLVTAGLATTIQYRKYFWLGIGLTTLIPMVIQNARD